MSEQAMDDSGPHWDRFRETAMGRYLLDREVGFLRRTLEGFEQPPRVLELCACGGRVGLSLRDLMADLVALDIDRRALRVFRQRSADPAVAADAHSLPFRQGSFDCVIAIQCLRYFETRTLLAGCERVLRPEGALVLQAVNRRGYKRRAKELVKRGRRGRETGTTGADEVLRTVASAGFEVRTVEGYNWLPFGADIGGCSDSFLVGLAGWFEPASWLARHTELSPWILVDAHKPARPHGTGDADLELVTEHPGAAVAR